MLIEENILGLIGFNCRFSSEENAVEIIFRNVVINFIYIMVAENIALETKFEYGKTHKIHKLCAWLLQNSTLCSFPHVVAASCDDVTPCFNTKQVIIVHYRSVPSLQETGPSLCQSLLCDWTFGHIMSILHLSLTTADQCFWKLSCVMSLHILMYTYHSKTSIGSAQ